MNNPIQSADDDRMRCDVMFQRLLDKLPAAAYTCDSEGLITYFNHRAATTWGRKPKLNDPADRYFGSFRLFDRDGNAVDRDDCWMARALRDGKEYIGEEVVIERPNGSRLNVLAHANPFFDEQGQVIGAVNMLVDITKREHLEERLLHSQKMETVGQLACGIAHDFNNMLSVILGQIALLKQSENLQDAERESLHEAWIAADRATALTRQLLLFGSKQMLEPSPTSINCSVRNLEPMLRRLLGEDLELVISLDPSLQPALIDSSQLEQVILNLAINARDAMPLGGTIEIRTDNVKLTEDEAYAFDNVPAGRYSRLQICDTGWGMDDSVKQHIFEPFFTTKEHGKGTGLGLATVYGAMSQCGGHIAVTSEVGEGTTFDLLFPICEEPAEQGSSTVDSDIEPGDETILLVEDEDLVRRLLAQTLRQQGYHVLEASCGVTALEIHNEYPGTIDLVLTDVVMPRMSGRMLAETLKKRHPNLQVIYISGYPNDSVLRHGIEAGTVNFIRKPFTQRGISEEIRRVLNNVATSRTLAMS